MNYTNEEVVKEAKLINPETLVRGDCLETMKYIPDCSVDLILSDPPYGTIACKWDTVIPFEPMWEQLKRIIKPNGAIVMTASQPFTTALIASNMKMFKYCWVWEKTKASNFVHANYQPLKAHEDVCVFSLGGSAQGSKTPMKYNKQMVPGKPYKLGLVTGGGRVTSKGLKGAICNNETGMRTPRSVIKVSNPSGKGHLHPTQKPVELMEYMIKTYSDENDVVLDFVAGSFSTGVACVNLNRRFIGIEKDDSYFEVGKKRIIECIENANLPPLK